jgi:hypothetical protein
MLTNGRPEWLAELNDALQADARASGTTHIGTGRDLRLTREQQHNALAMDMAVVQRLRSFLEMGRVGFMVSFFSRGADWGIVLELDVECGYASCSARLRVGQHALLVMVRGRKTIGGGSHAHTHAPPPTA